MGAVCLWRCFLWLCRTILSIQRSTKPCCCWIDAGNSTERRRGRVNRAYLIFFQSRLAASKERLYKSLCDVVRLSVRGNFQFFMHFWMFYAILSAQKYFHPKFFWVKQGATQCYEAFLVCVNCVKLSTEGDYPFIWQRYRAKKCHFPSLMGTELPTRKKALTSQISFLRFTLLQVECKDVKRLKPFTDARVRDANKSEGQKLL